VQKNFAICWNNPSILNRQRFGWGQSAGNHRQVPSERKKKPEDASETTSEALKVQWMSKAYILGALHDGCVRKHTFRIAQKYESYVRQLAQMIRQMGYSAWVYKEGANRNVFVVEFSKSVLSGFEITSIQDKIDYARGYFDAEGSVPLNNSRMYIYLCQKDKIDLEQVRSFLIELGIECGEIHNPSKKKDPNYWRFFVSSKSYNDFARVIGSSHPVKKEILEMKI